MDWVMRHVGLLFCVCWPAAVMVVFFAFFLDRLRLLALAAVLVVLPLVIAVVAWLNLIELKGAH